MRKLTTLIYVLLFSSTLCFGRGTIKNNEYQFLGTEEQNKQLGIHGTYYIHDPSVNSTIFYKDKITLFQEKTQNENSRFELHNDSTFRYVYNIKSHIVTKQDYDTGEPVEVVMQSFDEIEGSYIISDSKNNKTLNKSIKFILNEGNICEFNVVENENQISGKLVMHLVE